MKTIFRLTRHSITHNGVRALSDERGLPVIEFTLVAPMFLIIMVGVAYMSHYAYVRTQVTAAATDISRRCTAQSTSTRKACTFSQIRGYLQTLHPVAYGDGRWVWAGEENFTASGTNTAVIFIERDYALMPQFLKSYTQGTKTEIIPKLRASIIIQSEKPFANLSKN